MGQASVSVVAGDITRVDADALITAINSSGMWFGGIDGVIQRAAGNLFHSQAAEAMPLKDGGTVVAKSGSRLVKGEFENVVFVVDDLKLPLRDIVFNGLKAASEAGFHSVSLPTIRMGVMLGQVERTPEEAVGEMVEGVKKFFALPKTSLAHITFVVYNDEYTKSLLDGFFR